MDLASPLGTALKIRASITLVAIVWLAAASSLSASERYAVVVTGASGGEAYAQQYVHWSQEFVSTLRQSFEYPPDHIKILSENESAGVLKATRENVRAVFTELRGRVAADDVVLVLLVGHGTGFDSDDAKFNLVGPDLSANEWADLLKPIQGRLAFVDAASGSFPFLQRLAGRNHIVLTANDSPAQQFETVFPGFFIKAFDDEEADADKNGKVSVWEAFSYASVAVRRQFEEKGQLATERALLDDNGDGLGREADADGPDGQVAQVTYLQPDRPIAETGDTELTSLLRRRAQLETDLEILRVRKSTMPPDDYEMALEKILLEIAQIDRRVRTKSKS